MYAYSVTQLCPTLWPNGLQPSRFLCPSHFAGKNTAVGCHFFLQGNFLTWGLALFLEQTLDLFRLALTSQWPALGQVPKEKVKWSCVRLFVIPWTVAYQAPLSMGFSRQEYWSGLPISFSRRSFWPRNWTQVSCLVGRCFTVQATREV